MKHRAGRVEKARRDRRHLQRVVERIDRALERNAVEARTLRRRRAERIAELEAIREAGRA